MLLFHFCGFDSESDRCFDDIYSDKNEEGITFFITFFKCLNLTQLFQMYRLYVISKIKCKIPSINQ